MATIAFGREARRIDLADALDAAIGPELEEHEIAAAEGGRRIADDEGLEFGIFMGVRTAGEKEATNRSLCVRARFSMC